MATTVPIRVLIVDDHAMVRTGLRYFMQGVDDLELVAEASSGEEAVELCTQVEPDVVLMDMMLPGVDGAEATQMIRDRYPNVQIIALTSFQEGDLVERALKAGAISYLLKDVSPPDLAHAIRLAHAGQSILAQEATQALVQATRQKSDLGGDLSAREREVLALLVDGGSNARIAEQLFISTATVKFHVRSILSKLGATNRAEAVNLAWQYQLLSDLHRN